MPDRYVTLTAIDTAGVITLLLVRVVQSCRILITHVWTYRAIHGAGPSHFQSCFTRVTDMPSRRRLRSSGSDR